MKLELSMDEARILKEQLTRLLHEIAFELIRTEKRELQHALARDEARLQEIANRLERLVDEADPGT